MLQRLIGEQPAAGDHSYYRVIHSTSASDHSLTHSGKLMKQTPLLTAKLLKCKFRNMLAAISLSTCKG